MKSSIDHGKLHIMGVLNGSKLSIDSQLTSAEKSLTFKRIEEAKDLGYDICVVTSSGTYMTKRL